MPKITRSDEEEVQLRDAGIARNGCAEDGEERKEEEYVCDCVGEDVGCVGDGGEGWRGELAGYE